MQKLSSWQLYIHREFYIPISYYNSCPGRFCEGIRHTVLYCIVFCASLYLCHHLSASFPFSYCWWVMSDLPEYLNSLVAGVVIDDVLLILLVSDVWSIPEYLNSLVAGVVIDDVLLLRVVDGHHVVDALVLPTCTPGACRRFLKK